MASGLFAAALVLFHLALFTALYLYARERRHAGHAALAVALAFLSYVGYDLALDPSPHRLGGLSMGLTMMFGLMWLGSAVVYQYVATSGRPVTGGFVRWLVRRGAHWAVAGVLGTLAFGVAFPNLRGFDGAGLAPGLTDAAAIVGLVLALVALMLAFMRVRPAARILANPGALPRQHEVAARQAARWAWLSLAAGLLGLALLVASGFP